MRATPPGLDNEWLNPAQAQALRPPLMTDGRLRYPLLGAALQRRGGTARHDAIAWGYALGVDIIEGCEVTGIRCDGKGAVARLATTRGAISIPRVGCPPPAILAP